MPQARDRLLVANLGSQPTPFIFFHHIRAVSTITDMIPTRCENHSQIAAAERVPASRGGQNAL